MIHILGANGFVGSYLFKEFNENKNYDVKGYSSKDCDLLSPKSLDNTLTNLSDKDIIIMASSITKSRDNSLESMIKNIKMASNVGRFIKKNKIKSFIFLSTIDIYGINPEIPIKETLVPEPADPYAVSKLASEFILKDSCSNQKIPLLTLRLPGIYGPGDKGNSVINKLLEFAKKGNVTIYGDGENTRDFVYVGDIYNIIKEGIDNEINATLNIATGKSYSINKIVRLIQSNISENFSVEHKKSSSNQESIKKVDFNIDFLKQSSLNFQPTNLEKGLKIYIKESKYF